MKLSLAKLNIHGNKKSRLAWNPIHPHRDWKRILTVFLVLALVVVAWSAYLFYSSKNDSSAAVVPEAVDTSTTHDVDAIKHFYEARSAFQASTTDSSFVDPSF